VPSALPSAFSTSTPPIARVALDTPLDSLFDYLAEGATAEAAEEENTPG
jgi:hypothetical protein